MKIMFLIPQLEYGGAERQLVVIANGLRELGHEVSVAVFSSGGALEETIRSSGIEIFPLEKRGRNDILGFLFRLIRLVRRERPDVLHSYLGGANMSAALIKPFIGQTRVVWGIRSSDVDWGSYHWIDRMIAWLESFFSRFADLIIVNSRAGLEYHLSHGFPEKKMIVIPNGIDTVLFSPYIMSGKQLRQQWAIKQEEKLIGLVGRLDPIKDHITFLKAAAIIVKRYELVRFVCVGDGPLDYRHKLKEMSEALGLSGRLIWAGSRDDMSSVYNSLDMLTLTSISEGFPNVVAEAMACGVPCVVTDVGDSAHIVGDAGIVVTPNDHEKLAEGIEKMICRLNSRDIDYGKYVRDRVVNEFSVEMLIKKTSKLLNEILMQNR